MTDIQERLKALLGGKALMTGAELRHQLADLEQRRSAGEFEIDAVIAGDVFEGERGAFYRVRQDFPLDVEQGHVRLGAALEALPEHIALSARDEGLAAFDAARAAFIDAETTGLAGGTGTVAFLVGVGYFAGDSFRLEQCFMRDYDDEEQMLEYLRGLLGRFDTLVSFNGKSFDVPLLRSRFISNRIPSPLDEVNHLDLIHAARRFWKIRLRDCSLNNIERNVLGIRRRGDVPSALIPGIWFDYLRDRDARPLKPVFYHHRMDILSLVSLTALLSRSLERSCHEGLEHPEDQLSIVRLYAQQRRYAEVIAQGTRLLETAPDRAVWRQCVELVASAHKRLQDWVRTEETWRMLLAEYPGDLHAREELAKIYEHRIRNLPEARRICQETVQLLETRAALHVAYDPDLRWVESFRRRLNRLNRKLARAGLREEGPSGAGSLDD